jgi:hydroxymethylbilane synthase
VIRLGTRGSALALAQAQWVADRLPGEVEIVPIRTSGDEGATKGGQTPGGQTPLDKERFVKELDDALLAWDIDIAVHSAKDVPTSLARGLVALGAPERGDPRDAICGADSIEALPEGAVVGTASLRRRALLLALRPDLRVRELRGNVDTRLQRLPRHPA